MPDARADEACPDLGQFQRLVSAQLSEMEKETVLRHLEGCDSCAHKLNALPEQDTLVALIRQANTLGDEASGKSIARLVQRLSQLRPGNPPARAEQTLPPREAVPSTPLIFACPTCGKGLKVKSEFAGKKVQCPHCKGVTQVRAAAAAPLAVRSTADESQSLPDRLTLRSAYPASKPGLTEDYRVVSAKDRALSDFLGPAQAPDELGRLGPYRVLAVLGAGGMGVVFRAEDSQLARLVALKAMLPALAASESARLRFLREARAAAAINHDHIVTIYKVGEDRAVPYLAMQFLEGEPLDVRLQREGKLPAAEVLRIGREIALGLAAAHQRGLIHRDIKPGNLWLESQSVESGASVCGGRVKILDFGLARAVGEEGHLTQPGAIVGTPAYMAPEQGRGQSVDQRCDLFSLGCVLYRMATGKAPFKGTDMMSTLMAVSTHNPPPPHELDVTLPRGLSELIMRLLAKEADDRPASAQVVAEALGGIARIQMSPPAPVETLRRRVVAKHAAKKKWPIVVGVATCFMLVLAALWSTGVFKLNTKDGTIVLENLIVEDQKPVAASGRSERRTINLLDLLNVNKDAGRGVWEFGADGLKSPRSGITVAEFPYHPPEEYDFRIEFTCVSGGPQVNQFLARGDRSFSCILGAQNGKLFGLEMIAGMAIGEHPATVARQPMSLKNRHVCIAHVRNDQIAIQLDGIELVRLKTNYHDLSLDHAKYKHWAEARRNRTLLAVGTFQTEAIFHKAEVVEISDRQPADDKGFVSLFNGKDLTGWKIPPNPSDAIKEVVKVKKDGKVVAYEGKLKDEKQVPLWYVEDGVLIGSGPASHLFSERGDYTDFHFRVEAMINDKGNSGQYFRTKFGPGFPRGWEVQINATHGDPVKTGSLYPDAREKGLREIKEIQVRDKAPHKPNKWFTQEVIVVGSKFTILVNGKKTVEWTDPENRHKIGHFALQEHDPGTVVKFRKIEVKELLPPRAGEKEKVITNSIGMKLVRIPAGTFTMGSPATEELREFPADGNEDQHEVEITKVFWLGICEVTQKEFKEVMGYNPSFFSRDGKGKPGASYGTNPAEGTEKVPADTSDFPVENVSHEEAEEFCIKLTALGTESKSGRNYRLPTEAEWEYACRAGAHSSTPFHYGNSLSSSQANINGNAPYGGAPKGDWLSRTTKVGSYKPNAWGLFDMHGNVSEWCSDGYAMDYYGKSPRRDPMGPSKVSGRVIRGGSWLTDGRYCRSANRHGHAPEYRYKNLGFRVVLVPSSK